MSTDNTTPSENGDLLASLTAELDTNLPDMKSLFSEPLADQLAQDTPLEDVAAYQLVSRAVATEDSSCGAGHDHVIVRLVETFRKAADAPAAADIMSLDTAFDQVRTQADAVLASRNLDDFTDRAPGLNIDLMGNGDVLRVFELNHTFETEKSRSNPLGGSLASILAAAIMGGGRGGVQVIDLNELLGGDTPDFPGKKGPDTLQ